MVRLVLIGWSDPQSGEAPAAKLLGSTSLRAKERKPLCGVRWQARLLTPCSFLAWHFNTNEKAHVASRSGYNWPACSHPLRPVSRFEVSHPASRVLPTKAFLAFVYAYRLSDNRWLGKHFWIRPFSSAPANLPIASSAIMEEFQSIP